LHLKWHQLRWYCKAFEIFLVLFGIVLGVLGLIYSSIALKTAIN